MSFVYSVFVSHKHPIDLNLEQKYLDFGAVIFAMIHFTLSSCLKKHLRVLVPWQGWQEAKRYKLLRFILNSKCFKSPKIGKAFLSSCTLFGWFYIMKGTRFAQFIVILTFKSFSLDCILICIKTWNGKKQWLKSSFPFY